MESLEDVQKQPLAFRLLFFTGLVFFYGISRIEMVVDNPFVDKNLLLFSVLGVIIFLVFSAFLIMFGHVRLLTSPWTPRKFTFLSIGLLAVVFFNYFLYLHPLAISANQKGINSMTASTPPGLLFFIASIEAPIIEEILFRDIFWKLFFLKKSRIRVPAVLIISSLAFGLMHMGAGFDWLNFLLVYSLMGLILGLTRYFAGDVKISMLLHFFQNTLIPLGFPIFIKLIGG